MGVGRPRVRLVCTADSMRLISPSPGSFADCWVWALAHRHRYEERQRGADMLIWASHERADEQAVVEAAEQHCLEHGSNHRPFLLLIVGDKEWPVVPGRPAGLKSIADPEGDRVRTARGGAGT